MSKKKVIILAVVLILAVGAFTGAIFMNQVQAAHQRLLTGSLPGLDLSVVSDGAYTGSYSVFPVLAEVKVTVKDHAITNIELTKHRNGKGAWAEAILDKVVAAQSLDVDVVAGATISSKVIMHAISNALGLGEAD